MSSFEQDNLQRYLNEKPKRAWEKEQEAKPRSDYDTCALRFMS